MNDQAKLRKRGFVWLFIGLVLTLGGMLILERPLVLRGTQIPFGPVILGIGVLILGWDYLHFRRERDKDPPDPNI